LNRSSRLMVAAFVAGLALVGTSVTGCGSVDPFGRNQVKPTPTLVVTQPAQPSTAPSSAPDTTAPAVQPSASATTDPNAGWEPAPAVLHFGDVSVTLPHSEMAWQMKQFPDGRVNLKSSITVARIGILPIDQSMIAQHNHQSPAVFLKVVASMKLGAAIAGTLAPTTALAYTDSKGKQYAKYVTELVGAKDCVASAMYQDTTYQVNGNFTVIVPGCGGKGGVALDSFSTIGKDPMKDYQWLPTMFGPSVK